MKEISLSFIKVTKSDYKRILHYCDSIGNLNLEDEEYTTYFWRAGELIDLLKSDHLLTRLKSNDVEYDMELLDNFIKDLGKFSEYELISATFK